MYYRKIKWNLFSRGHCDVLLSADMEGDGVLDTDVLIRKTPWVGGYPPTEEGMVALEDLARTTYIEGERAECTFPPYMARDFSE